MPTRHDLRITSAQNILTHLHQEFPSWNAQFLNQAGDLSLPRSRHPIFYGSYDWHSSVHSHWALLKAMPSLQAWERYNEALDSLALSLSSPGVSQEVDNWPSATTMQTPYGATWFLRLCAELRTSPLPNAQDWLANLEPLEIVVAESSSRWMSDLEIPDRSGQHANSAWSLQQLAIYARSLDDDGLLARVSAAAADLYLGDKDAPFAYEPSAASFFSPLLTEAALLAEVLPSDQYNVWLKSFAPEWFAGSQQGQANRPMTVDASDLFEAHLVALPLTKSIALSRIAPAVSDDTLQSYLKSWATDSLEVGLAAANTPEYAVSHWISSYVIEALSLAD